MRSLNLTALLMSCLTPTILIGCTGTPTLPEFQGEPVVEGVTQPVARCTFPELGQLTISGEAYATTDVEGVKQLRICQHTEEVNHDIAAENAAALMALQKSYNTVIDTTRRDHELAEFVISETNDDRRSANFEAWSYKGLLVIVLIAVAL